MNPKQKTVSVHPWERLIIGFACILVVAGFVAGWGGYWSMTHDIKDGSFSIGNLSSFGSFLQGATGSLWALAGLLFIAVTFLAQKRQLSEQSSQFKRQSFENLFCSLMETQENITSQLHYEYTEHDMPMPPKVHSFDGRACFRIWYCDLAEHWRKGVLNNPEGLDKLDIAKSAYQAFYDAGAESYLAHYFRSLYHVFKFINDTNFGEPTLEQEEKTKKRYASIIRSHLSPAELQLLFYNGISGYGDKFFPLIVKFDLLEQFPYDTHFHSSHESFYNQEAERRAKAKSN